MVVAILVLVVLNLLFTMATLAAQPDPRSGSRVQEWADR